MSLQLNLDKINNDTVMFLKHDTSIFNTHNNFALYMLIYVDTLEHQKIHKMILVIFDIKLIQLFYHRFHDILKVVIFSYIW